MPRDPSTAAGSPLPQRVLLWRYSRLVALSIGARALGFGTVVLMARGLGVEMFGEINYARVVVGYGLTFTVFGMGIYGVHEVIRHPASTGRIASTIIVVRLALGLVAFTVLSLVAMLPPFRPVALLIVLFGTTVFTAAISVTWVAQAEQRTDVLGIASLISQLFFMGQVLLAIKLGLGKHSIPVALVISELIVNVGLLRWMYRRVTPLERPFGLAECKQFLIGAAPVAASQFLRVLSLSSDMMLLGMLVTMDRVGAYGAAYKLRVLGFAMVGLYMTVVLPHLTHHHGKVSVRRLSNEVISLLWKMLLLALPAAGLGIALAPWILETIFGPEYLQATTAMRLLILATIATLVGSHYRPAVLALGKHKSDLRNVGLGTAVHVGAKVGLIPLLGLTGAAMGTVAGEATYAIASWLTLRHLLSEESRQTMDARTIEAAELSGSPTGGGLDLD